MLHPHAWGKTVATRTENKAICARIVPGSDGEKEERSTELLVLSEALKHCDARLGH